jgi:tetratricopeptide (TPR) repeat protein
MRYLGLQADNLEQAQDLTGAIALQQRLLDPLPRRRQPVAPNRPPTASGCPQLPAPWATSTPPPGQYQAAYANAIDQGQLEVATNAVTDLAEIYKTLGRQADVVYLYEQLLLVSQQAHSAYGMMNAYDQLGQVHEQLGATPSALAAYREGLVLARVLSTRQAYFEAQIARLTDHRGMQS